MCAPLLPNSVRLGLARHSTQGGNPAITLETVFTSAGGLPSDHLHWQHSAGEEASGVTVSSNAKTTYEEVKKDRRYRYIIYYIKDEKVIEVESTGPRDGTYQDFLEELNKYKTDCRYCVFDFPVNIPVEGSQEASSMSVNRLVLMRWCPEQAKVKQKMLYSSSYEALKRALVGIYKYVQACEYSEASQEAIEDVFTK